MKALIYDEPGGPDVLQYRDVDDPTPGLADVAINVDAVSLNRLDVVQRNGWFQLPGFAYPHIAGMDMAGTVIAIGDDVVDMSIGDRVVVDPSLVDVSQSSRLAGLGTEDAPAVLGGTVDGGYAEKCVIPRSNVYAVPEHIPLVEAATFPTSYMTASHALFNVGELESGETVLIHAAGSGLSTAAIQLAKHAGATVLATAGSDAKCQRALELGADQAVNNRSGDVAQWAWESTGGTGVNLVFDHVGTALFGPSLFSLAPRGRLVCCGNSSGDEATIPSLGHLFHLGIRIMGSDAYSPEEFGPTWEKFCDEKFMAVIDSEFALEDGAAAQEKMLSNDFFGKIVLRP